MSDAEDVLAFAAAAIAALRAARTSDAVVESGDLPGNHRSRVPPQIRHRLAKAPGGLVEALTSFVELPRSQDLIIGAAVDLLGVVAPKEKLVEIWLRHGLRINPGDAGDAFVSALRDRGEEGYWILDELSAHAGRELAEAKSPGLAPARMRELALTGSHLATLHAIIDRDDVPVDLIVDLARSSHPHRVADHPKLPVDMILELARSHDYYVAARAIENPAMPAQAFAEFARHEAEIVRLAIAERARYDGDIPIDVAVSLANDRSDRVRAEIEAWRLADAHRN